MHAHLADAPAALAGGAAFAAVAEPPETVEAVQRICHETLAAGPRPHRFADACLAAIVWRRFDRARARSELEALIPTAARTTPPLLAWAWRVAVGDPAAEPGIVRHHGRIESGRMNDDDPLLWTPRRVSSPRVCATFVNVLHGLSRLALGQPSLTPTLLDRLYDERHGTFHDLVRRRGREQADNRSGLSWTALSPLALPDLPEHVGRRLVEEHLIDPRTFWLPVAPAAQAASDPDDPDRGRPLGLWRHRPASTRISAAWFLWLGLVRLGYSEVAGEVGRRIGAAVAHAGLRESYDSFSGDGLGASGVSGSALVIELLDPDPLAPYSHLPAVTPVGRARALSS